MWATFPSVAMPGGEATAVEVPASSQPWSNASLHHLEEVHCVRRNLEMKSAQRNEKTENRPLTTGTAQI